MGERKELLALAGAIEARDRKMLDTDGAGFIQRVHRHEMPLVLAALRGHSGYAQGRATSADDLDPAEIWEDYLEEIGDGKRSPQGALAFGFWAAYNATRAPEADKGEVVRSMTWQRGELCLCDCGNVDRSELQNAIADRLETSPAADAGIAAPAAKLRCEMCAGSKWKDACPECDGTGWYTPDAPPAASADAERESLRAALAAVTVDLIFTADKDEDPLKWATVREAYAVLGLSINDAAALPLSPEAGTTSATSTERGAAKDGAS